MTSTQNRIDRIMFLPTPSRTIACSSSASADSSSAAARYALGSHGYRQAKVSCPENLMERSTRRSSRVRSYQGCSCRVANDSYDAPNVLRSQFYLVVSRELARGDAQGTLLQHLWETHCS